MTKAIEVHGLDEIIERMQQYPLEYQQVMLKTMATALLAMQENIPPYPPKPMNSRYKRTGTLGRSLGSSEGGGQVSTPDIFKIRKLGIGHEGKLGSNLKYAGDVIGPVGVQKPFFAQYWWRLETVIGKSYGRILELYQKAADKMAAFLEGKGK